jgi:quinol monooxygenase YgiN
MTVNSTPLADHLAEPTRIGSEISVTGKWVPRSSGLPLFGSGNRDVLRNLLDQMATATKHFDGCLTVEVDHTVGGNAALVHFVFTDSDSLADFYGEVAAPQFRQVVEIAEPDLHIVRGAHVTDAAADAMGTHGIPFAVGDFLFGYVKHDYQLPDLSEAIDVTAKWTCKPTSSSELDQLKHWWQMVGTDAFSMEEGLVRFEAYQVAGEDALIIHETFENTSELKFHLTKGTAHKYKKSIDEIAVPERYYFRGPVA